VLFKLKTHTLRLKSLTKCCHSFQTLPNGERLSLPPNVRIMFEVHDLKYATPATVSRCGMIWFSEDVLKTEMIFENFLTKLQKIPLEEGDDDFRQGQNNSGEDIVSPTIKVSFVESITFYFILCAIEQISFSAT
jgi:dynein heavy chain 1